MKFMRAEKSKRHRSFYTFLKYSGIVFLIGIGAIAALVFFAIRTLPDPMRIVEKPVSQSTKIYDRTGQVLLYEIHGEERRTVIPFSDIPSSVKQATLAAEDDNFYNHSGIDFRGILRALYVDIRTQSISQGGSTITQQLIKKTLVGEQRTPLRKVKEAILALVLEKRATKDQIFELYLNQIPYGSNAYGIEAAAETFFGKAARDLTLAESALLASLPKGPSYYSPYGQHSAELLARKDALLDRMEKLSFISKDEAAKAKQETLNFKSPKRNILAPHFVMYVKDQLLQQFDQTEIENGGLKITTTLDWNLQSKAEEILLKETADYKQRLGASNAALVALDPKTGQIVSMVGSRDYWDIANDGNVNVTVRPRQPGSAFKPFAYLTAFQKGYEPETVVFDVPTEFNASCTPDFTPTPPATEKDCYHPKNYDDSFRGPVTLRKALQQSLNVPSVEVLYLAGIDDTIKTAESLGISTLQDRTRFGLSLVLGGGEVKLLEMASAYGAFADEGILNPKTAILKIEDGSGETLYEFKENPTIVLDTEAVQKLNSVMSDNESRVPVFARNNALYFPNRMVAAKTGTTQENRDAWTVGYTPSLVAGVWVGNNDNTPMKQKTAGVLAAAPLWKQFMTYALGTTTPETFTPPPVEYTEKPILRGLWQGGTIIKIDTVSKKEATEFTPPELIEEIAFGEPHSILYWVNKDDPRGPQPEDPSKDSQYTNWEEALRRWLRSTGYVNTLPPGNIGKDDIHTPENKPIITIATPLPLSSSAKEILITVSSKYPLHEIIARFDALRLSIIKDSENSFRLILPNNFEEGLHTLTISASDGFGNNQAIEKELDVTKKPS